VKSLTQQYAFVDGTTYAVGAGAGVGIIDPTATSGGTGTTGFSGNVQDADTVHIRAVDHVEAISLASGVARALLLPLSDIGNPATTSPKVSTTADGSINAAHDIVVESVVFTDTQAIGKGIDISGFASISSLTSNATDSSSISTEVTGGSLTSPSGNIPVSALHHYDEARRRCLSTNATLASVETTNASLLVQVTPSNVTADATTSTTATTMGSSTLSAVGGPVIVEARSANIVVARGKSSGGGTV